MSTTTNPRINVTLSPNEFTSIQEYATAMKSSLSQALLKLALEKLDDYEDMMLGEKCLKRMKDAKSSPRLTMKDFENAFDELPE
ncbi:hypothetical protein FACS189449_12860 [Alphaproteobacteria bacterium]|nr:hypothetical protein FACS189449_12860 [Alphaproteobacteria bacterium]